MFDCLFRAANRVLDGIEEFGYALAGLPTIHSLEDMVTYHDENPYAYEREEARDAAEQAEDAGEFDEYDVDRDGDYDWDDYYEGYYDEEDYV